MANSFGTTGDDIINVPNTGNNVMYGGADDGTGNGQGNDTFNGLGGREVIYGGSGEDSILSGLRDDIVYGGSGNDNIRDEAGTNTNGDISDLIYGGTGDDTIRALEGADAIFGGIGADDINAGAGNDLVFDGAGNDTVNLNADNDIMVSGSGDDNITAGTGTNTIYVQENWGVDSITAQNLGDNLLDFSGTVLTDANLTAIGDRGPNITSGSIAVDGVTSTGVNLQTNGGSNGFLIDDGGTNTLTSDNFLRVTLTDQADTALFDDVLDASSDIQMGGGDDVATVRAFIGDFSLDGGTGSDSLIADYANTTSILIQNSNLATITDPGFDELTVTDFENFATTDGADFITVERAPDDLGTIPDESLIPVVTGNISSGANADTVIINDGVTVGDVNLGSGDDTITITEGANGVATGNISGGSGSDRITVVGGTTGNISGYIWGESSRDAPAGGEDGPDIIDISGGAQVGNIISGDGGDTVTITDSTAQNIRLEPAAPGDPTDLGSVAGFFGSSVPGTNTLVVDNSSVGSIFALTGGATALFGGQQATADITITNGSTAFGVLAADLGQSVFLTIDGGSRIVTDVVFGQVQGSDSFLVINNAQVDGNVRNAINLDADNATIGGDLTFTADTNNGINIVTDSTIVGDITVDAPSPSYNLTLEGNTEVLGGNINLSGGNNTLDITALNTPTTPIAIDMGGGDDTFLGASHADSVTGGAGNDELTGGSGDDTIAGGSGNDTVFGGAGIDELTGGAGNDTLYSGSGDDTLTSGSGDDTLYGGVGNDVLNATGSNATLFGGSGDDALTITNGTGTADISGGAGSDTITIVGGTTGNISGYVWGRSSNNPGEDDAGDVIDISGGAVVGDIISGDGGDTVTITDSTAGDIRLEPAVTSNPVSVLGSDNLGSSVPGTNTLVVDGSNVGNIAGLASSFSSIGTGFPAPTDITITNASTVSGGIILADNESEARLTVDAGSVINSNVTFAVFSDPNSFFVLNNAQVQGGVFNAVNFDADNATIGGDLSFGRLTSGLSQNTITDSTIVGDILGRPGSYDLTLEGDTEVQGGNIGMGTGADILDVTALNTPTTPIAIDMRGGDDTFLGSAGGDNVTGGAGNDELTGGAGNDDLTGGSGDDTITGGSGDDTVFGGAGNDELTGGAGNDTLYGGSGDDIIVSGGGNATLVGGAGNNTITAGDGDDVVVYTAGETLTLNDFGNQTTGPINDGVIFNNDFMDLSGFYDDAAAQAAGYGNASQLLAADLADGTLDGQGQTADGLSTFDTGTFLGGSITFNNTPDTSNSQVILEQFGVLCFARGTLIETDQGDVPVEELRVGMHVRTKDDGYQPLRWIGSRNVQSAHLEERANLRPIVIRKGALGPNFPERDLTLSQQHRVLLRSDIVERMFNVPEVLTPAKKLLGMKGIEIDESLKPVQYFHMLFDTHQVVRSNGAFSESLYLGPQTRKTLEPEQIDEIQELFPELISSVDQGEPVMQPGRKFVFKDKHVGELVQRTRLNRKHLIKL